MTKEMPCGKEFVEHYEDPAQAAKDLIPRLYSKRWFGFAEVDIEVPRDLWEKFEEFPPLFVNKSVGAEGVSQHMQNYLKKATDPSCRTKISCWECSKQKRYFCTPLFWSSTSTTVFKSRPFTARSTTYPKKSSTGSSAK